MCPQNSLNIEKKRGIRCLNADTTNQRVCGVFCKMFVMVVVRACVGETKAHPFTEVQVHHEMMRWMHQSALYGTLCHILVLFYCSMQSKFHHGNEGRRIVYLPRTNIYVAAIFHSSATNWIIHLNTFKYIYIQGEGEL